MLDFTKIIQNYYNPQSEAYRILITHSQQVTDLALSMAFRHPELNIDTSFVSEAAMLHDIGIFLCYAPDLDCHGSEPYIRHGLLGAQLLRSLNLEQHARVCERHTGTGLTVEDIVSQNLPLPHQDFSPVTMEEQLICYADKFFSKTHLDRERTPEQVRQSIAKFGPLALERIDTWQQLFL